ncbi:MAG: BMP family protein [Treponema sp.]|nr:BMP family protein [Treponema sp.]
MKKFLFVFGLSLVVLLGAPAIFAKGKTESPKASSGNAIKIAMIVESTVDDKGWCQAMYDGIMQAQKSLPGRIEFSYSEKMLPVDAGSAARQYAAQGFHIIIGHGSQYKNLMLEMAEEYPNITFAFGTSSEIGPKNVFTYMPENEETGYISGVIAGLVTKNNSIGMVGPVDGGGAARYDRGYVLGIQKVNPKAKITIAHSGSFSDFVKAGEIAHSQIKNGVDVLTGSSQQAIGALRAVGDAAYSGQYLWWVGEDLAQFDTAEGKAKCIAATSYNYAPVIVGLVEKFDAGIRGGECIPMNFSNGGFVFEWNKDLSAMISSEMRTQVDEALASFRKAPNTLSHWSSVDYSNL